MIVQSLSEGEYFSETSKLYECKRERVSSIERAEK